MIYNAIEPWALETLKKLQAIDPLAHIAGGYLRDLDNGRRVKDLDIYMHNTAVDILALVSDTHPIANGSVGEQYAISDANVTSAISFLSDKGLPELNVIMLTKPMMAEQNIERFDFGICRIAFDGEKPVTSWEYECDRMAEIFTLRRCVNKTTFALSMGRYKRLEEKYTGWDLVILSRFTQYLPTLIATSGGIVNPDADDIFA